MNSTSRRISLGLLTAGLALTGVTACGGQDGSAAPKNASVKAFCAIIAGADLSDPKALVDDLVDTGTPTSIPADARAGFEVMIEKADQDEISDGDQVKVNAFVAYFTKTCAGS